MSVPIRIAAACCLAIITGLSGGCERRPPTIAELRGLKETEVRTLWGEPVEVERITFAVPDFTGDSDVDRAAAENAKRYSPARVYVYRRFRVVFNSYDEVIAVE